MKVTTRPADSSDRAFMRDMLREAATAPGDDRTTSEILSDPKISRYIDSWGRTGDIAAVAISEDSRRLGAAWLRLFDEGQPGYGFVDEETPELTIAVKASARGKGVGGRLLDALLGEAAEAGFARVSLSVAPNNAGALDLYRSRGFEPVASDEQGHLTMTAPTERPSMSDRDVGRQHQ